MSSYSSLPHSSFRFEKILYRKSRYKATITINRPDVHNCLDLQTLQELGAAFQDAAWDDRVAVVVITGAGDKAFCTGADLKEWNRDFLPKPNDFYKWMGVFAETFERLKNIGKPTIARLNGMAVGGGNELQMSCDLTIAADDAYIRHVGTEHGSVPAAGATQWLPLIVGDRRAREILFLCEKISARKALEWGLVNEVVPRADLDAAVDRMVAKLVRKLPECTRYTKQQLNFWRDFSWAMTIGHARDWLTVHTAAPEIRMSIESFMKKQPVDYEKIREMTATRHQPPAKKARRTTKTGPTRICEERLTMASELLIVTRDGWVATVQFNRPEVLNALNMALMAELVDTLESLDKDDSVRCIILTGNEKAFAAGADIKEMADASAMDMLQRDQFARWDRIRKVKKPIIAAVSGFALGGGCELMMTCDIVIASETARIGQPEINIGVMPGAGGTQRLTRAVGKVKAMEMVLTGGTITADEALKWGLVNRVVPAEVFLDEAKALAKEIASKPPIAVRLAKEAVLKAFDTTIEGGLEFERKNFYMLFASEDQKEGMKAFVEKRKAEWKGR